MEGALIIVFGGVLVFISGIIFGSIRANCTKTLVYGSLILGGGSIGTIASGNVLRILVNNDPDNAGLLGTILGIILVIGFLCIPFGIGAIAAGCIKLATKANNVK